jgi:hypothetical protein
VIKIAVKRLNPMKILLEIEIPLSDISFKEHPFKDSAHDKNTIDATE